jgi:competence protein ComEC
MHLTAGTTSFLLTGDAEKEVEKQIINEYSDISATVLKVGHHGSNTSSSSDFLKAVNPDIAVIPVGEGNKYGHPTDKTLTNLKKFTDTIYRTDKNGTVTFICTKDGYTVKTEK